jgi:L-threonylcarbamoyladenylate synthase
MPRVIAVNPGAPEASALVEAARVLRAGGLVAFPTETVYGLGALALDADALARVFEAKGRPTHHPLIAHVENVVAARALALTWPDAAEELARAFWPGPLTLVVERASHVPAAVAGGASSIALRVPAHPVALALLAHLGAPIAAPSANRYQGISPTTAAHVVKELGDRVDLVLDGGMCTAGIESTVVDVRVAPVRVLRLGAADLSVLRRAAPGLRIPSDDPDAAATRSSPGMDARHYAPRARLVVAPSRADALREATHVSSLASLKTKSARVGLVLRGDAGDGDAGAAESGANAGLVVRVLPADPEGYASRLYETLHALDDAGVAAIVVESVPSGDAWLAVADRLKRGSTPSA